MFLTTHSPLVIIPESGFAFAKTDIDWLYVVSSLRNSKKKKQDPYLPLF